MGTDKTHVGFVSENQHDFVGFCLFFPTDTNRHKYFHKPTQCRVFVGFGPGFSTKQGTNLIYFGRVYGCWKLKIKNLYK